MSVENPKKNNKNETYRYKVGEAQNGLRIDKALSDLNDDLSRSRAQALIVDGQVFLNGFVCKSTSKKLVNGSIIDVTIPPPVVSDPHPENIPLDVIFEDDDIIVINKQAGLVVHPSAGNWSGTLVNALLYHCGDSLSGIGGVMRPGIVHRLDKDTSGIMIAAKNDKAHKGLSRQLEDRTLSRIYKALVLKVIVPPKGVIDKPIGRHPVQRTKMAIRLRDGKQARTYYHVREVYHDACALVECRLESGRTHQIRVHMESIKHPLIGDQFYGAQPTALRSVLERAGYDEQAIKYIMSFPRQALHAQRLSFMHPCSEEQMSFEVSYPDDFFKLLNLLSEK